LLKIKRSHLLFAMFCEESPAKNEDDFGHSAYGHFHSDVDEDSTITEQIEGARYIGQRKSTAEERTQAIRKTGQ
jgi:hypothetical protein